MWREAERAREVQLVTQSTLGTERHIVEIGWRWTFASGLSTSYEIENMDLSRNQAEDL